MNPFFPTQGVLRRFRAPLSIIAAVIIIGAVLAVGRVQIAAVSEGAPANTQITSQYLSVLNGDRSAKPQELVTDDAAIHTPEGEFLGSAGVMEFVTGLRRSFPTATFASRSVSTVDNNVILLWTMIGVQYGDYQGVESSCAGVTVDGVLILRFEDQLIDEQWFHYDRLALIRQIEAFNQIDPNVRPDCRNL